MRMLQVLVLALLASLVAVCQGAETPVKKQLTISTRNSTATAKALQKFFTDDAKKNSGNGFLKVVTISSTDEERAGATTSGQGARTGAGTTVVASDALQGEQVTVTIYNNNGLWQRFQRWWNRLFTGSSSRRLRLPRTTSF